MTTKPKKKNKFNANGATLKWLELTGWTADIVEYRIPKTFITRDLFGCIDILAMKQGCGIVGIQATSGGGSKGQSNGLARRRKLLKSEKAKLFVQCGGTLWLAVWHDEHSPSVSVITIEDFELANLPVGEKPCQTS